jgi:hypothetical protein
MAANVVRYGAPRTAVGTVVVVICSATTSNVNAFVATNAGVEESLTRTVTLFDPAAVGVPDTTPVLAPIDNPAGSTPAEIDHVLGANPPLTANSVEYATPTTGLGTVFVVIVGFVAASAPPGHSRPTISAAMTHKIRTMPRCGEAP